MKFVGGIGQVQAAQAGKYLRKVLNTSGHELVQIMIIDGNTELTLIEGPENGTAQD